MAVEIALLMCRECISVMDMTTLLPQAQIENLYLRMRQIRESRHLTLIQAAKLSHGEISAIALGSYERGDRSVSARKLITIARLYEVPISELFEAPQKYMNQERLSIDLRKVLTSSDPVAQKITEIVKRIAQMRGDWNGEVISLRSHDVKNLEIFTSLTATEIKKVIDEFGFPRLK
jgi:transcriptional regulator with XRE-family HTH domain